MAILAAKICKLSDKKIYKSLNKIKNVKGRLENVKKFKNNIRVYIDYAHTPDALKEALLSLKNYFDSEITLVFGCGGERDQKKRSLMANIAKTFCKKIYVTDDNPRKENPKKIRSEIIKHIKGSKYFEIGNRSEAIREAIIRAEPNEVILIAGKGHEDTQDYGNKVISISDRKIIEKLKISQKKYSRKKINLLANAKLIKKIINYKKKNYIFDGLTIDSREVKKDNLFLAIKGKNNDGNKFIDIALKKGARFVATSKNSKKYKNKIIKIKNSFSFLNKFANLKRKTSRSKIIGITGSAGKTSLKNMLFELLQNKQNTFASPRSFNNHYGVPLSLSNLNPHHRFGIFEIGMSKPGEINKLSKIVKPNIAVITNIAEAHIENFKDISGIAKAKGEIIKNINKSGTLIINRDDKFFDYLKKEAETNKIKVRSFGSSKNSNVRLLKVKQNKKARYISIKLDNEILNFEINNINIFNVLASIAVLRELNLDINGKISLFKKFQPSEGRGKVYKIKRYKKKFNLIDESYNANPFSVKTAINTFKRIKKDNFKKYLLLGDMLELGKNSDKYHKDISKLINTSDIDKVFIKGDKTLFTYKNLRKSKRGNIFQCNDDVDSILQNIITNNDYLMVKGSNATGLNLVCKTMIKGN
tara:strand:+ start:5 stop:1936 length:1932 start_codon:yes stop_codon:yes gene_type:complete